MIKGGDFTPDILAACRYRDNKNSRDEIHLSTIEFFVANGGRHMQQADRAVIGKDPPWSEQR